MPDNTPNSYRLRPLGPSIIFETPEQQVAALRSTRFVDDCYRNQRLSHPQRQLGFPP